MIARLKGTLIQKSTGQVVIDAGGVGYCASIPLSTYVRLGEVKETVELFIHTHLTDSSLTLFGFATGEEKNLFLKLIAISGIGPRLALNILSGIGPKDLEDAVEKSDVARISLIPGIGKKTALRIALELQAKLDKKEKILAGRAGGQTDDLVSALLNLGFRRNEVETVVAEVVKGHPAEAGFETLLRDSLRRLARL
ncbi:MAG: Holliday junction DNA helicase RuvA [Candidatus Aminicenantes bacterium RBG_13_62_12]|nr:MAG: Holliday junction DNA helicase RuvA [Candidatus Aminicenantes bacterium RBG_13_62_12]